MSSFRKEYDGLADAIVTNAIVMDAANAVDGRQIPPYYYTDIAAWDTGAQFSFISPRIVEGLGLKSCGKGQYMGIGGDQESDIFKVHIGLSNGEIVRDLLPIKISVSEAITEVELVPTLPLLPVVTFLFR